MKKHDDQLNQARNNMLLEEVGVFIESLVNNIKLHLISKIILYTNSYQVFLGSDDSFDASGFWNNASSDPFIADSKRWKNQKPSRKIENVRAN